MTREQIKEKLLNMIGSKVTMFVDRPIHSTHPKHKDIVYGVNYGYIKEIMAADEEYQDVYILGESKPIDYCKGLVCAVIERENDIEDKLVVVTDNKDYSIEEIKEKINFQERIERIHSYRFMINSTFLSGIPQWLRW